MIKFVLLCVTLFIIVELGQSNAASKVICHYDSKSFLKEGK